MALGSLDPNSRISDLGFVQDEATGVDGYKSSPQKYAEWKTAPPKVTYRVVKVKLLSRVRLFVTPWTAAHQASLSMGSSRQEHGRGLPFPSSGDLPDPRIEPGSPASQADALLSELPGQSLCGSTYIAVGASVIAQLVKKPPARQETLF